MGRFSAWSHAATARARAESRSRPERSTLPLRPAPWGAFPARSDRLVRRDARDVDDVGAWSTISKTRGVGGFCRLRRATTPGLAAAADGCGSRRVALPRTAPAAPSRSSCAPARRRGGLATVVFFACVGRWRLPGVPAASVDDGRRARAALEPAAPGACVADDAAGESMGEGDEPKETAGDGRDACRGVTDERSGDHDGGNGGGDGGGGSKSASTRPRNASRASRVRKTTSSSRCASMVWRFHETAAQTMPDVLAVSEWAGSVGSCPRGLVDASPVAVGEDTVHSTNGAPPCAPTLRAHPARPPCAPTLRAHPARPPCTSTLRAPALRRRPGRRRPAKKTAPSSSCSSS